MSNPEHFRGRADVYLQLALDCTDERNAETLFDIASMFNSMANELTLLRRVQCQPSALTHHNSFALKWLCRALPYRLGGLLQTVTLAKA
jgi:hypothetical protein